jgi:hypothetical protein
MIGPLRAILLAGLALYVLARPRTRTLAGLALVAISVIAIIAVEYIDLPWANQIEAIIYGVAGFIVIFEPTWLVARGPRRRC